MMARGGGGGAMTSQSQEEAETLSGGHGSVSLVLLEPGGWEALRKHWKTLVIRRQIAPHGYPSTLSEA